jgi:hypothetical protein
MLSNLCTHSCGPMLARNGRPMPEVRRFGLISRRTMKLTAFQVHKWWLMRAVLVLLTTGLADGAVVWFAQRPILWAVVFPGSLPLSMFAFVAIPILREEKRKSQIGISGRN